MLLAGELDAAIYGAEIPKEPRVAKRDRRSDEAAKAWYAKHRLVPVNHMVVVTDELARAKPQAVAELYRLLQAGRAAAGPPPHGEPDLAPFGKEANRAALELLIGYAVQQHLLPRKLTFNELW